MNETQKEELDMIENISFKNKYILEPMGYAEDEDGDEMCIDNAATSLTNLMIDIKEFITEQKCKEEDVVVVFDHEDGLLLYVK